MTLLFSVFKLLLTKVAKDRINTKIIQIRECCDWSKFDVDVCMDDIDLSKLNYSEVVEEKNMWENIAKLSINLINDFDYFRQFIFEGQYDSAMYVELLENLGCVCTDGIWRCVRRPDTAVVQTNVFMHCLYRLIYDEMEKIQTADSNTPKSLTCFFCGHIIEDWEDRCDECDTSIEDIRLNYQSINTRVDKGDLEVMRVARTDNENEDLNVENIGKIMGINMWNCENCEFSNSYGNEKCLACGESMPEGEGWICELCSTGNSLNMNNCAGCANGRDENDNMKREKVTKMKEFRNRSCGNSPTMMDHLRVDDTVIKELTDDCIGMVSTELEENICDNGTEISVEEDLERRVIEEESVLQDCEEDGTIVCNYEEIIEEDTRDNIIEVTDYNDLYVSESSITVTEDCNERDNDQEEVIGGYIGREDCIDLRETLQCEEVTENIEEREIELTEDIHDFRSVTAESEINLDWGVSDVRDDTPIDTNIDARSRDIVSDSTVIDGASALVSEAEGERWECVFCSYLNKLSDKMCFACHMPGPDTNKWLCERCTFINELSAQQCAVCFTLNQNFHSTAQSTNLRLEEEPELYFGAQSLTYQSLRPQKKKYRGRRSNSAKRITARRRNNWVCNYCSESNDSTVDSCATCGEVRDNY